MEAPKVSAAAGVGCLGGWVEREKGMLEAVLA